MMRELQKVIIKTGKYQSDIIEVLEGIGKWRRNY